ALVPSSQLLLVRRPARGGSTAPPGRGTDARLTENFDRSAGGLDPQVGRPASGGRGSAGRIVQEARSLQADLRGNLLQPLDRKPDELVLPEAEVLLRQPDLLAVHPGSEGLLLQFLLHGRDLHAGRL